MYKNFEIKHKVQLYQYDKRLVRRALCRHFSSILTIKIDSLCNEDNEFRFIRNIPFVTYPNNSSDVNEYDFMGLSLNEIKNLIGSENLDIANDIRILESTKNCFLQKATLNYDHNYCVNISDIALRFFKDMGEGKVDLYDPPHVSFEVLR